MSFLYPLLNIVQLDTERVVFFIGIPPRLVIVFGMVIVNFDELVPELVPLTNWSTPPVGKGPSGIAPYS